MATQSESSTPFDLMKSMTELDPTHLMGEFTKALRQYHLPGIDVEGILESQRKNVEALTAANKAALEGIQKTISRRDNSGCRSFTNRSIRMPA